MLSSNYPSKDCKTVCLNEMSYFIPSKEILQHENCLYSRTKGVSSQQTYFLLWTKFTFCSKHMLIQTTTDLLGSRIMLFKVRSYEAVYSKQIDNLYLHG